MMILLCFRYQHIDNLIFFLFCPFEGRQVAKSSVTQSASPTWHHRIISKSHIRQTVCWAWLRYLKLSVTFTYPSRSCILPTCSINFSNFCYHSTLNWWKYLNSKTWCLIKRKKKMADHEVEHPAFYKNIWTWFWDNRCKKEAMTVSRYS